jgi:hypothetical protein
LESAARALRRYRHVSNWCDLHGRLDSDGEVRSAATYELAAERELIALLDALGMTPTSRAKLGLRLVQASAAAADAEANREARERLDRRFKAVGELGASPEGNEIGQQYEQPRADADAAGEVGADEQKEDPEDDQDGADHQSVHEPLGEGHGRSVSAGGAGE